MQHFSYGNLFVEKQIALMVDANLKFASPLRNKLLRKKDNYIEKDGFIKTQVVVTAEVGENMVTVQPSIYYIHKPASKLSVAATQLMFTSCNK